jgi:tRNA pseudouridine38-40 synthase
MNAINFYLKPNPIAVIKVESVSDNFDARFSAQKRHYIYKIINRKPHLSLDKGLYWQVFQELDIEKMQEQANFLLGRHNFNSFRCSQCSSKDPIKTLDSINIIREDQKIFINLSARSFLHKQVRITVGTLVEIGKGKNLNIECILKKEDRKYAGPTAPPYGLYLKKIDY